MPAPSALPPQHPTPTLPPTLLFEQFFEEALIYANMVQTPYPPTPPLDPPADNLTATAKVTAKDITRAPSLLDFITSWKRGTLEVMPEAVLHMEASLL